MLLCAKLAQLKPALHSPAPMTAAISLRFMSSSLALSNGFTASRFRLHSSHLYIRCTNRSGKKDKLKETRDAPARQPDCLGHRLSRLSAPPPRQILPKVLLRQY